MAAMSALALCAAPGTSRAQTPYWLDSITVLATKIQERAIDALAAVSTVREEQLRQIMPDHPHQIFQGVPGVWSEATAQDPGTAINIRGLQDFGRVAVVVDGARQNFARLGHDGAGSFYLEPELVAEADVIRGPVANIYGSGAIGGVVSFRTKDVDDILKPGETWGVAAHGQVGSNLFSGLGSVFAATRAGQSAEFIAGGTFRHLDDYKDGGGTRIVNSGEEVASGLAKATFRPADGHQVKLGAIHYDANWVDGTPGVSGAIRDADGTNSTFTANWRYSKPEDRLFDFNGTAYWNRVDVRRTTTSVMPGFEGFFGNVGNVAINKIDTLGFDVNNTSRFDFGPVRHALTYGGDWFADKVDNTDAGGFEDGFNPTGKRTVGGGFVQLKSNYSTWLEVISALRYDTYKLNGMDSTGALVSNHGDRLSPKVTVGVTPLPWFTVYGTYAEGYRAPAVTETLVSGIHPNPPFIFLANPDLQPEVGKSKEIGINIRKDDLYRPGDRLRIKANVFRNDVDDFIDTGFIPFTGPFGDCPSPPFCIQYQNITKARIQGVELESLYDAGGWFVGLNGHRIRGKDVAEGDPLAKTPPDMVAATFGLRSPDRKYTVALRWAAVAAKNLDDLPSDATIDQATGSYNLVNLYLGYQPNENVIAALSVENLLNETYKVYLHEFNSPGITVKGSVRVRFAGGAAPTKEEKKFVK
jgi:hemoglobin/transferrin/lactoferrin receptor protein